MPPIDTSTTAKDPPGMGKASEVVAIQGAKTVLQGGSISGINSCLDLRLHHMILGCAFVFDPRPKNPLVLSPPAH